jgi:hypothetical protein
MRRPAAFAVLFTISLLTLVGCATSYSSERSAILVESVLNNAGALGAPQQSVAAEWAIRDFVALMVTQNTEQAYLMYALVALLALSFLANLVVAGRVSRVNQELAQLRAIFTTAADRRQRNHLSRLSRADPLASPTGLQVGVRATISAASVLVGVWQMNSTRKSHRRASLDRCLYVTSSYVRAGEFVARVERSRSLCRTDFQMGLWRTLCLPPPGPTKVSRARSLAS